MQVKWNQRTSYLLAAVGAHVGIRFAELVAPYGLMPHHVGVLRRLSPTEGRTQQEVADEMRVRRSVMVGLIDDLETKGYVERRRHPLDRRANALHLTEDGTRVLAEISEQGCALDEQLLAAIPAAERSVFHEHLWRLAVTTGVADGVFPERDPEARAADAAEQTTTTST